MSDKNLNITIRLIAFSAFIPAIYLLGVTLFLLIPALFGNIKYNTIFETVFLFLAMIFGILGFIGISMELFIHIYSRIKTKIIFLSLGIIGYILFMSILSGVRGWKNTLESIINIQENWIDFYFVIWPNIITLILIFINVKLKINGTTTR
jgi:hypothetical protein